MTSFHYIYVLRSQEDGNNYVGYTNDLKRRIAEHQAGAVPSTRNRRPLELIYYEACLSQADATKREKYLKSSWGKRYLKNRLEDYLTG